MSEDRPGRRPSLARVIAAFAAVYVLWGSTYLGIRFSIETLKESSALPLETPPRLPETVRV